MIAEETMTHDSNIQDSTPVDGASVAEEKKQATDDEVAVGSVPEETVTDNPNIQDSTPGDGASVAEEKKPQQWF